MILPRETYLEEVKIVPPADKWQKNAVALDLRIGTKIYYPAIDTYQDIEFGNKIVVFPGAHFLIQTLEKVTLPEDIAGVVYPRSGVNRRGVSVDITGIVDPGYSGHLMIPVSNHMTVPVEFFPGERIAQIMFHRMENTTEIRESKYQEGKMAPKPDKQEEIEMLQDGSLFNTKVQLLKDSENEGKSN